MWKLAQDGIQNKIFVLDHVAIRKSTLVQELIFSGDYISMFLPPYTPQFNSIENVFSKWKYMVKKELCQRSWIIYYTFYNVQIKYKANIL